MRTVVTTEIRAVASSTALITASMRCLRRRAPVGRSVTTGTSTAVAVTALQPGGLGGVERRLLLGGREGDEQRLLGDGVDVVEVVVDERLHLGPDRSLLGDVDEQRTAERLVGTVLYGLGLGRHTPRAAVDL